MVQVREGITERCGWADDSLLAEVGVGQTAAITYRLPDHEGSLAMATDGAGNVLGANIFAPYGQGLNEQLGNAYAWAGLFQDTEYSGDAAWYRDYSTRAGRWLTPDPYNGSYNTYRPQSFNRYMYVNGNPLGFTDASGLALGIVNGIGGSVCKGYGAAFNNNVTPTIDGINPCNPVESIVSLWIDSIFNITSVQAMEGVAAVVSAAVTIACSIDYSKAACGPKGWASDVIGGIAGKVVGDTFAVAGAVACMVLGPDACIGYAIYTIANDVFAAVWDALGLGPPQFNGSLLPRPTDLGGLGTAPIGIPNKNLSIKGILGQQSRATVQSPGVNVQ